MTRCKSRSGELPPLCRAQRKARHVGCESSEVQRFKLRRDSRASKDCVSSVVMHREPASGHANRSASSLFYQAIAGFDSVPTSDRVQDLEWASVGPERGRRHGFSQKLRHLSPRPIAATPLTLGTATLRRVASLMKKTDYSPREHFGVFDHYKHASTRRRHAV